MTELCN